MEQKERENEAQPDALQWKYLLEWTVFLYWGWFHGADAEAQEFDCRNIRTSPKGGTRP